MPSRNSSAAQGSETVSKPESRYGNHPLHSHSLRPLHVIVIGAGPSGIATLIQLKSLAHVTFQCFEKNSDVGGTWLETRYPGAACDVASHAYQYTFEEKKDWSRHFAPAEEIGEYFISVAKKYDIYPYIDFNSRVVGAKWDETRAKWVVSIMNQDYSEAVAPKQAVQHEADILINAGGILNDWKWPDIPGLGTFKGETMHTAAWDSTIDLAGKSVAVIGSGASSIQLVPSIQPVCKSLEVFVRSPTYILPTIGFGVEPAGFNEHYSESDIERFSTDPVAYRKFRKNIEQQMNENFVNSVKASEQQVKARLWAEAEMKRVIKSPDLQQKLIPSWEFGCRRITPGMPYLEAVQKPNVDVIRSGITNITDRGLQTEDGVIHPVDVIICATGFNTSFSSRFPIIGREGITLDEMWKRRGPEGYLGLAISGLPNYFSLLGPNCPIANGSLVPCIEWSTKYIIQAIEKIQRDLIQSLDVKQPIQDAFNDYAQLVHQDLVWTGSCRSWYKDSSTDRVIAVWPGSSIHFMEMVQSPRWEDFNIEYKYSNPFIFMGNGVSQREAAGRDLTFYLDAMNE